MVYFSTKPAVPQTFDQAQFRKLTKFRDWCEKRGLIQTFDSVVDFEKKFFRQLGIALNSSERLRGLVGNEQGSLERNGSEESVRLSLPSLSEEAKELLKEAAVNGTIMKVSFLGGRRIQTNGKTFGDPRDRRSMARWEFAIDQLIEQDFICARGPKGEIFEVTHRGYEYCEREAP